MMFFCCEYETQFLVNGCRTHDKPGLKGIRFLVQKSIYDLRFSKKTYHVKFTPTRAWGENPTPNVDPKRARGVIA